MSITSIAQALRSILNLSSPPVALAFVAEPPERISTWTRAVPSACALWRHAEQETFYAPADQHYNCPIGAMTMGFDLPPHVQSQLQAFVGLMMEKKYIAKEEPGHIPSVPGAKSGIVYGPLEKFPLTPDLALVWCTPAQAMILEEAVGDVHWKPGPWLGAFGRPACAALPIALKGLKSSVSLGCTGMRTFTGIEESRLLVVLPKEILTDQLLHTLESTRTANDQMKAFYLEHKQKIEQEASPETI